MLYISIVLVIVCCWCTVLHVNKTAFIDAFLSSSCVFVFSYAARGAVTLCGLTAVFYASNYLLAIRLAQQSVCPFISVFMTQLQS